MPAFHVSLVDRMPVTKRLKDRLQIFFKYELFVWIHSLHFVMIGLVWLHVQFINCIADAIYDLV